ncbi:MAG: DUF4292 domain-containing protein [Bacteroidales bacterium]|jgi:hypothetical protein|nr:DUF4292 domain-containing protein [Bacteroidales bacterium]
MISNSRFILIVYFFLIFAVSACSITSKTEVSSEKTVLSPEEIDVQIKKNALNTAGIVINGAKIKIIQNNQTQRLRANLKSIPGESMLISLSSSLGIEIARALITPDSIRFIDRINRNYLIGSYSTVASIYNIPVDYKLLQDALFDLQSLYFQSFHYPTKNYKPKDGYFQFFKEDHQITYHFKIDQDNFFISRVQLNFHNLPKIITLDYSNYTKFDQFFIPMDISATISDQDKTIQVNINYSDMRIEPVQIKLIVPSSYHRIYP